MKKSWLLFYLITCVLFGLVAGIQLVARVG